MLISPLQGYPQRLEEQDNGTSYSLVLYTSGWYADCGDGVDVWYLSHCIIPLCESYANYTHVTFTHWST
jgi:hypothetical protein